MRQTPENHIKEPLGGSRVGSALPKISKLFVAIVIAVGVLVLLGWQFNLEFLRRPIPHLVAMNPLTAISFVAVGLSFLFITAHNKTKATTFWGRALAWLTITTSTLKLCDPFFPFEWQIDHMFFANQIRAAASKELISSMAINTALGFIFSAISLLLLKREPQRRWVPAHIFALVVFAFGFFSLLGYLYQVPEFYDLLRRLPMAVHTAICFMLVSLAVFFVYPNTGLTKEFTGTLYGSYIGRYLILGAFVAPVVLGGLRVYVHQRDFISSELGTTLLVLSFILVFCSLTFYSVFLLNERDQLQRQTEAQFRSLVTSVKDYAIFRLDLEGNIVTWNLGAEDIKGYKEEEIKGKHVSIFYTNEDIEKGVPQQMLRLAKEKGRFESEGLRIRKDGSVFWADTILTALYGENGKVNGFVKVTRDDTERKKARDMLAQFNEELERQVTEQTHELENTATQLRQLAAYLQTVREEERKYIAREIHDEMGQMLTGLRMDMVWLKKKTDSADQVINARFERALELLADARQEMRRLSTDLHPALLEHLGLVEAMGLQAREFEKRTSIKTIFAAELDDLNDMDLTEDIAIGFYRVFQETLTNTSKHAEASEVKALLKKDADNLILRINDNGKGFNIDEVLGKKTLGLISIRERALMMDGDYRIVSAPGKGTTILLTVPIKLK